MLEFAVLYSLKCRSLLDPSSHGNSLAIPRDDRPKFESGDFRNGPPRFPPEARAANLALLDLLKQVAERKRATPAQIALAWLLTQKPWIVPIPGTTKLHRLEENIGAADVELTADDLREIEDAASRITVQGARLLEAVLALTDHS
jgi:aryl-alcohol dehydrogenase-like predicted oxidoreductase